MLASRLVSSAYQPSVAASASMASWSSHQVRAGFPGPAVQVVAGAGELLGAAGRGRGGPGAGVHEDTAQRDGRVAFALGVADLKRLAVFEDVPAAPLLRALMLIAPGDVAD